MADKVNNTGTKSPAPAQAKASAPIADKPTKSKAAKPVAKSPAPTKGNAILAQPVESAPTVTASALSAGVAAPAVTAPVEAATVAPATEVAIDQVAVPQAVQPAATLKAAPAPKPAPKPVAAPVVAKAPVAAPAPKSVPAAAALSKTVPAAPAVANISTTPTPQKETSIMENTINNAAEKTQSLFVEMNDRAKAAMEKTQGLFAEMNDFNKGNVEALVESSKIAVKGIESMGQDAAEYTRKSFEGATAVIKSLASVKSPTEFMKLHSDYVRTSFDQLVAESSKNTEAMLKLAGEIAQPISNRVAVAAEKIKVNA